MSWRDMDSKAQKEIILEIVTRLTERLAIGQHKYQSHKIGFQGSPLVHLEAELYDAIIYLEMLKRQAKDGE